MSLLTDASDRFKADLLRDDVTARTRLAQTYGSAYGRLAPEVDRVARKIEAARANGEEPSIAWLHRIGRLSQLQEQAAGEMSRFGVDATDLITRAQRQVSERGGAEAEELTRVSFGDGAGLVQWNRVPKEALTDLVGNLSDGSPLSDLFDQYGPAAATGLKDTLTTGLVAGWNPARIAVAFREQMAGNLTRALVVARTETLRVYRESSRRSYAANSDVVDGWVWLAALTARTCPCCWAMNGTFHGVEETLDGHPSCRCCMVPRTKSMKELGLGDATTSPADDIPLGESVFAGLSPLDQHAILGDRGYQLYSQGQVHLSDFVGRRENAAWGSMRYVLSPGRALAKAEIEATTSTQAALDPEAKRLRDNLASKVSNLRKKLRAAGLNEAEVDAEVRLQVPAYFEGMKPAPGIVGPGPIGPPPVIEPAAIVPPPVVLASEIFGPGDIEDLRSVLAYGEEHGQAERLVLKSLDNSRRIVIDGAVMTGEDLAGVDLTEAQRAEVKTFDELTTIHNHPIIGERNWADTFSAGDLQTFTEESNFRRAHIVLPDGQVHTILRTGDVAMDRDWLKKTLNDYHNAIEDVRERLEADGLDMKAGATRTRIRAEAMQTAITTNGLEFHVTQLEVEPVPITATKLVGRDDLTKEWFNGKVTVAYEGMGGAEGMAEAQDYLFGRQLTDDEWARLVGAPDGATVTVVNLKIGESQSISVTVEHELYDMNSVRSVARNRADGLLRLNNDTLHISPDAPKGLGTRIFATQVEQATKLGFDKIETLAAGDAVSLGEPGAENGFYTWPRLGYNLRLQTVELQAAAEKAGFGFAEDTHELFAQQGGAEWWKAHGIGGRATFDLAEDSASRRVLADYLRLRDVRVEEEVVAPGIVEPVVVEPVKPLPLPTVGRDELSAKWFNGEGKILWGGGGPPEVQTAAKLEAQAAAKELFGRELADSEWRALAGASDGLALNVIREADGSISLIGSGNEMVDSLERSIYRDPVGRLVMKQVEVNLSPDAPAGMGTRILATQVDQATKLGVERLVTFAAGTPGDEFANGYYTWPRLGYNSEKIQESAVKAALKTGFQPFEDLHGLFVQEGGPAWWKANGHAIDAYFDLADNSASRRVLGEYLKLRDVRIGEGVVAPVVEPVILEPVVVPEPVKPTGEFRKFASREEAEVWANGAFKTWADGLTRSEQMSLIQYTKDDYAIINDALRDGVDLSTVKGLGPNPETFFKNLADAMSRGVIPEDVTLYRKVGTVFSRAEYKDPSLLVGRVFKDDAYMSTSMLERGTGFGGPNTVELRVPAGTRGAALSSVSDFPTEGELLLDKGQSFRVTGFRPYINHEGVEQADRFVIEAELVPAPVVEPAVVESPAPAPTGVVALPVTGPVLDINPEMFSPGEKQAKEFFGHWDDWDKGLSEVERKNLKLYKGWGYDQINPELRTGVVKPEFAQVVKDMDAAISRGVVPENIHTWRGVTTGPLATADADALVGTTFRDDAYGSWTIDRKTGTGFAVNVKTKEQVPTLIDLVVPKGHSAAYLDKVGDLMFPEHELMMARGMEYRVTAVNVEDYTPNILKPDVTIKLRRVTVEIVEKGSVPEEASVVVAPAVTPPVAPPVVALPARTLEDAVAEWTAEREKAQALLGRLKTEGLLSKDEAMAKARADFPLAFQPKPTEVAGAALDPEEARIRANLASKVSNLRKKLRAGGMSEEDIEREVRIQVPAYFEGPKPPIVLPPPPPVVEPPTGPFPGVTDPKEIARLKANAASRVSKMRKKLLAEGKSPEEVEAIVRKLVPEHFGGTGVINPEPIKLPPAPKPGPPPPKPVPLPQPVALPELPSVNLRLLKESKGNDAMMALLKEWQDKGYTIDQIARATGSPLGVLKGLFEDLKTWEPLVRLPGLQPLERGDWDLLTNIERIDRVREWVQAGYTLEEMRGVLPFKDEWLVESVMQSERKAALAREMAAQSADRPAPAMTGKEAVTKILAPADPAMLEELKWAQRDLEEHHDRVNEAYRKLSSSPGAGTLRHDVAKQELAAAMKAREPFVNQVADLERLIRDQSKKAINELFPDRGEASILTNYDALYPKKTPAGKQPTPTTAQKKGIDAARNALAEFKKMIGPGRVDGAEVKFTTTADGREYYRSGDNTIGLAKAGSPHKIVIHELGHWLEEHEPKAHEAAQAFLDRRTAGELSRKLRDITGNRNYERWEEAKEDKFRSPYIGKIYPAKMKSTEVLSMGLEYMVDDPIKFAKEDPDMFELIYDIIQGAHL